MAIVDNINLESYIPQKFAPTQLVVASKQHDFNFLRYEMNKYESA